MHVPRALFPQRVSCLLTMLMTDGQLTGTLVQCSAGLGLSLLPLSYLTVTQGNVPIQESALEGWSL